MDRATIAATDSWTNYGGVYGSQHRIVVHHWLTFVGHTCSTEE